MTFPIPQRVVTPYWDGIDLRQKGELRYTVISGISSRLHQLRLANKFISEVTRLEFRATWMLVAYWVDVCEYNDENCTQVCNQIEHEDSLLHLLT